MSNYPERRNSGEIKELLQRFQNLKQGKSNSFLDEDDFEAIIEYLDEQEQSAKALEVAEYGVDQYSFSAPLLIKKADLLIVRKRYKEALTVLEKAEIFDSNDISLYILKTDAYLALDMQAKAAEVLEKAIHDFNGDEKVELLFELSDVYDDYEAFEKVFDCLQMILEIDPENEEALYKICFWTDFTGRNEEGIKLHQAIVDEYPFNALAWFNLGAAYQGLKLYEKSIDAYQYAIAIDDKFDIAMRNMGDALIRLKKYDEAIEALKRVLTLTKPEDVMFEAIGFCFDKKEDYANARFYYKKSTHLNPDDSSVLYKIACTYINEQNYKSAIKFLESALRILKEHPDYLLALGQCYMGLEEYQEAIDCFSGVLAERPKNKKAWEFATQCFLKGQWLDEALVYCYTAYETTGNKPIFLYYYSLILFEMGKSKEAILWLNNALEANPKLLKNLIEFAPTLLQNQMVVDCIARHKTNKKRS